MFDQAERVLQAFDLQGSHWGSNFDPLVPLPPPPPVNWAINSLVKSSAFIADPAELLFKILSHSLGASDLGCGSIGVPSL